MSKSYDEGYEKDGSEWACSFTSAAQSFSDYTAKDQVAVFGGPEDALGMDRDKVNSPEFGASFSVTAGAEGAKVRVDAVRARVYYRSDITLEEDRGHWPTGLSGIASGRNSLVAVGAGGRIIRSVDGGANWSEIESGIRSDLRRVRYLNGEFVAVGANGAVIKSQDEGLTWEKVDAGTGVSFHAMSYSLAAGLTVVGPSVALRTKDLQTWRDVSV